MSDELDLRVIGMRLAELAQNGLAYSRDPFDIERFEEVRKVAARLLSGGRANMEEAVLATIRGERGYATPKVDVRGVIFHEGKILLVRERQDGLWSLPGGWAEPGQTPRRAVEKEVLEESGIRVRAVKLLAVLDRTAQRHPPGLWEIYKLFIRCEIVEHRPLDSNIETSDAAFFSDDALPPLSLPRMLPAQIQRMFTHLREPDLPADLD